MDEATTPPAVINHCQHSRHTDWHHTGHAVWAVTRATCPHCRRQEALILLCHACVVKVLSPKDSTYLGCVGCRGVLDRWTAYSMIVSIPGAVA